MPTITFQILEGVDRGRIFRDVLVPATIGREEGNAVRLNDERVSRFHAKVQFDQGDLVLTDLESTNGTRVNDKIVQVRRLRHGDCISVGRSKLLFGSNEEIAARLASSAKAGGDGADRPDGGAVNAGSADRVAPTMQAAEMCMALNEADLDFDLNLKDQVRVAEGELFIGSRPLPPLPLQLTPSQAARLAEILDFMHRGLTQATESVQANEEGTQVTLDFASWQKVLAVQMLLARYLKAIVEPESLKE